MRLPRRALLTTLLVPLTSLACAAPASAGLTGAASGCSSATLSQPFTPWLDFSSYTLAPGGGFESGPAWSVSGGAAVTDGNETFDVGGATDSSSLSLPDGSSATSPAMCIGLDYPTMRFFARNGGSSTSLKVEVLWQDAFGGSHAIPIGNIAAGASWQPTAVLPVIVNWLTLGSQTSVAFRFTPVGSGGGWQIDDVYVDPWSRS